MPTVYILCRDRFIFCFSGLEDVTDHLRAAIIICLVLPLNSNSCSRDSSITLCRFASRSISARPNTATSSAMPNVPGQLSRIKSIFYWDTSCNVMSPNSKLRKQYLPNGLFGAAMKHGFEKNNTRLAH